MKWLIKKYMVMQHIDSLAELSKLTGIARRTLYDRIADPKTIRLYELEAIDKVLHFDDEDLIQLTKGNV